MSDFRSTDERSKQARKRQVARMRRRFLASGDAALGLYHLGVWHPHDCPCFDCLYGEVREVRLDAKMPPGTRQNVGLYVEPKARGRFVK